MMLSDPAYNSRAAFRINRNVWRTERERRIETVWQVASCYTAGN